MAGFIETSFELQAIYEYTLAGNIEMRQAIIEMSTIQWNMSIQWQAIENEQTVAGYIEV